MQERLHILFESLQDPWFWVSLFLFVIGVYSVDLGTNVNFLDGARKGSDITSRLLSNLIDGEPETPTEQKLRQLLDEVDSPFAVFLRESLDAGGESFGFKNNQLKVDIEQVVFDSKQLSPFEFRPEYLENNSLLVTLSVNPNLLNGIGAEEMTLVVEILRGYAYELLKQIEALRDDTSQQSLTDEEFFQLLSDESHQKDLQFNQLRLAFLLWLTNDKPQVGYSAEVLDLFSRFFSTGLSYDSVDNTRDTNGFPMPPGQVFNGENPLRRMRAIFDQWILEHPDQLSIPLDERTSHYLAWFLFLKKNDL